MATQSHTIQNMRSSLVMSDVYSGSTVIARRVAPDEEFVLNDDQIGPTMSIQLQNGILRITATGAPVTPIPALLGVTNDQRAALDAANSPDAANPIATMQDIADLDVSAAEIAAINAANSPSGANPFATVADLVPGTEVVTRLVHVDKNRVDSYTEDGTQERPYKTVQAAVDYAETLTPSHTNPVVVLVAPGIYAETVTIKKNGVSLQGIVGQGVCRIQATSGPSLVLTNATTASLATFFGNGGHTDPDAHYGDLVADTDNPWDNQFRDIAFGTPAGGAGYCIMVLGVGAGNSTCGNEANFMGCHVAQDFFARCVNYLAVQDDTWEAGSIVLHNVAGMWASRVQLGSVSVSYNTDDDQPSDTGNYGLCGASTFLYGNLSLSGSAQSGYDRLDNTMISGNITLADTAKLRVWSGHVGGAVTVAGGARLDLNDVFVSGAATFTAGAPDQACTMIGGAIVGALSDTNSRLTFSTHAGYSAGAPANWATAPTDVTSAIDRIAAAVQGLLAGPIP